MIQVIPVSDKKQLKQFVDFPHDLYQRDNKYVPELFIAQRDLLTPGKHPFHEHSQVHMFLAVDGGVVKGRVAAILNNNHNAYNGTTDGFFGFFDCVDDQAVASALLDAAAAWLKEKGATTFIGPVNPSTNETCGLLVEGFDTPPMVMMPYNAPYYGALLEKWGLHKKTDLLSYDIDITTVSDRSIKLRQALENRLKMKGITIRPVNVKKFDDEVAKIQAVYNSAWDKNLGFVPFTDSEFRYMAKDLKMILDPKLCLVAEQDNKLVGFALALPNLNEALIKVKRGRLLPTGIFKLLFGLKKVKKARVLTLGVIEGYRKLGIEACFYALIIERARERNMNGGEGSWILEHNEMMRSGMESLNATVHKKHRLYEKAI